MHLNLNVRQSISLAIVFAFLVNTFGPLPIAQADPASPAGGDFVLPAPGAMVHLSPAFNPPILKGIKVHPDNPFRFDFIMDVGDGFLVPKKGGMTPPLQEESTKLIKYFLASLTIPEQDLWVNLSPYEKDRIIPNSFGLTQMGRDLLAQDYMLKQITASLIYPEDEIGKKFWKRIYEEAAKKFGTTNIPVNTFNKVWIVPEKAVVYENVKAGTAYVVESKLKVMLEQDYLALEKNTVNQKGAVILSETKDLKASKDSSPPKSVAGQNDVNALGSSIVRQIVIPELTKEVNQGKNFSQLRQVYNSLILATWYKKKIKDSILAQVYADKNKVAGVNYNKSVILNEVKDLKASKDSSATPQNDVEKIYQRYLQAFKKGVYNYIKEESDPITQETIPRKYFSGGADLAMGATNLRAEILSVRHDDKAILSDQEQNDVLIESRFDAADLVIRKPGDSAQLTSEKPKISVIIPTYNNEKSIGKTIESVLKQSYQNFEIIAVNDGSTDNTEGPIRNLMKNDERIKYIKNSRNIGRSAASNRALDIITGDYVVLLDADDTLPETSLEQRVNYLQEHPDLSFVYTSVAYQLNGHTVSIRKVRKLNSTRELAEQALLGLAPATGNASLMYRRNIFRRDGHVREIRFNPEAKRGEDANLLFELDRNGYKSAGLDVVAYNYEQGTHKPIQRIINRFQTFLDLMRIINEYGKDTFQKIYFFVSVFFITIAKMAWELFSNDKNILAGSKIKIPEKEDAGHSSRAAGRADSAQLTKDEFTIEKEDGFTVMTEKDPRHFQVKAKGRTLEVERIDSPGDKEFLYFRLPEDPRNFIYIKRTPDGFPAIRGALVNTKLRGHGLMRFMIQVLLHEYPYLRYSHPQMRDAVLMKELIENFGFKPIEPVSPNAYYLSRQLSRLEIEALGYTPEDFPKGRKVFISRKYFGLLTGGGQEILDQYVLTDHIDVITQDRTAIGLYLGYALRRDSAMIKIGDSGQLAKSNLAMTVDGVMKAVPENETGNPETIKVQRFKSIRDFLENYHPVNDFREKEVWTTVQDVINSERKAAKETLRMILKMRQRMDELGFNETPLLIWQVDRLGRMYPKMTDLIKKSLGVDKFVINEGFDPNQAKSARYIYYSGRVVSLRTDKKDMRKDAENFMRIRRLQDTSIDPFIIVIDNSSNLVFSTAQWFIREHFKYMSVRKLSDVNGNNRQLIINSNLFTRDTETSFSRSSSQMDDLSDFLNIPDPNKTVFIDDKESSVGEIVQNIHERDTDQIFLELLREDPELKSYLIHNPKNPEMAAPLTKSNRVMTVDWAMKSIDESIIKDVANMYTEFFGPRLPSLITAELFAYYMSIKKLVNPGNLDKTVLYGGSGVDIQSVLLATNANRIYMVQKDVKPDAEQLKKYLQYRQLISSLQGKGYGVGMTFHSINEVDQTNSFHSRLAQQLVEMGLDFDNIDIKDDHSALKISFKKKYPGTSVKRLYEAYLIQADITDPDVLRTSPLSDILKEGIDIYFQKAGFVIPVFYKQFMDIIYDSIKKNGFFVTDDWAGTDKSHHNLGEILRNKGKRTKMMHSNENDDWQARVQEARRRLGLDGFYGWQADVRQKVGDNAMIGNAPGGIDFTANKVPLQIKKEIASSPSAPRNDTLGGIQFHLDPGMLAQLQNAPGFVPVIINIQPMTNLRMFLGINDSVGVDKSA